MENSAINNAADIDLHQAGSLLGPVNNYHMSATEAIWIQG